MSSLLINFNGFNSLKYEDFFNNQKNNSKKNILSIILVLNIYDFRNNLCLSQLKKTKINNYFMAYR